MNSDSTIQPGLLVLHGNRLEGLRDAVFQWLAANPLDPLEEEIVLVQSNGAAEWLKMSIARDAGICAATRLELPGRFLWRTYRQVLGRNRVLAQSVLEKNALAWRLMRLLPGKLDAAAFAPVATFLADHDLDRRLQLARRLADLYDQYQVYRADWLSAWEDDRGRPMLATQAGQRVPMPEGQRWQAELWRAILDELGDADRWSTRPHVHREFMMAMAAGSEPAEPLPRRVVLFGASHVSVQGLEALAALSSRVQVILAIPNPCRFHWADIIEGREALRGLRHRHPSSGTQDLATVPLEAMHLHAHPLLAAWGRQGRDFMRQLDAFDDPDGSRRFELPRLELFDDDPGTTMLEQVQAAIRDLVPLAEHPPREVSADDRSIVFHVAHGPQREVEILHDQLLVTLGSHDAAGLRPRDVVVMVPDIEVFAPAIRAVFGQYRRDDARFIPFEIADLARRGSNPLVVAVEWLLRIPDKRIRLQEVRDLLDVPAIAARFGVDGDALPGLFAWLAGSGVRWGLHEEHRACLDLEAAGMQNSWLFGIRRMLLGYMSGASGAFEGIEPYDEVAGLDASVVGSVVDAFERLESWWSLALDEATPAEWARRGRELLDAFVKATDERERLTIVALQGALAGWLEACELARFDEAVPLSVLREAWLGGVDGLDASRRFMTGGVTFCTLMPLRAVPFDVVCLLGMNDGDFPRAPRHNDFDLMTLPGQQRPGDRSRRDDDRYLMLEAVLSARRLLYLSWSGRSARDNAIQPPSVLVSQLREYLSAAWHGPDGADGADVLALRTTMHPLQPFSRRYFERDGLPTFAREWRAAHVSSDDQGDVEMPPFDALDAPLTVQRLVRFLRNPVREFFRARLGVQVADEAESVDDDEAFELDALERYQLRAELLADPDAAIRDGIDAAIERRLDRVIGAGRLPMFELGARLVDETVASIRPMLQRWVEFQRTWPNAAPRRALRLEHPDLLVDDWLDGLRSDGSRSVWISLTPSRVVADKGQSVQPGKLLGAWVAMLVATVCDCDAHGFHVAPDATLAIRPLPKPEAESALADILAAWRDGMATPLPFALKTALAFVEGSGKAASIYNGSHSIEYGEGGEFSLARVFPDFDALRSDGRFDAWAERLFKPMSDWVLSSVVIVPATVSLSIAAEQDSA